MRIILSNNAIALSGIMVLGRGFLISTIDIPLAKK
jgi:hypothetical protein